ncbi:uncharacterized protein DSM5745_07710 [Aspergillus mulundensis]|uniref:Cytochrome P450 n=1 Tax=Aspergillus mulundensis TaxID=1810919 RepID=A0A3D8RF25_9EURO|nr:hypothetical protein DSM5745_07710 [Aspergillus mulundensis]RDW72538.1 hypothetical protein DSM5745_07710 [Aspergillus mulundensis]
MPDSERKTERLANHALELFTAGTVTLTDFFTVTLYHVLCDRSLADRLSAELADIMAGYPASLPTWQDLERLPFLHATVKEGLRLSYGLTHPLPRISPDSDLHFNQWTIPAGIPVGMSAYSLHRDATTYPDPLEFQPDRWLAAGPASTKMHRNWVPFSRGSRNCLGMKLHNPAYSLAYAEMYWALAVLFRPGAPRLELFETDASDVTMVLDFVLPSPKLEILRRSFRPSWPFSPVTSHESHDSSATRLLYKAVGMSAKGKMIEIHEKLKAKSMEVFRQKQGPLVTEQTLNLIEETFTEIAPQKPSTEDLPQLPASKVTEKDLKAIFGLEFVDRPFFKLRQEDLIEVPPELEKRIRRWGRLLDQGFDTGSECRLLINEFLGNALELERDILEEESPEASYLPRMRLETLLSFPIIHQGTRKLLVGNADYTVNYTSDTMATSLVILPEAKHHSTRSCGRTQCLTYMAMVHEIRKAQGYVNTVVYGIVSDGSSFEFLRIDNDTKWSEWAPPTRWTESTKKRIYTVLRLVVRNALRTSPQVSAQPVLGLSPGQHPAAEPLNYHLRTPSLEDRYDFEDDFGMDTDQ